MKIRIITALVYIVGMQYLSVGQTTNTTVVVNELSCMLNYSEANGALAHNAAAPVKCREITIASLPPLTQSLTPVNIEFGLTGSFTFKKDPALEIQDDRDVYIEDMLTGKVFDLKNGTTYSFNVNRRVPNRFVLHVDKMISNYSVSYNNR